MKPHISYSKIEQTAQQLWTQFNPATQEKFWQQYDTLLEKHRTKIKIASTPVQTVVETSKPRAETKLMSTLEATFKPSQLAYTWGAIIVGLFVIITIGFVGLLLRDDIPVTETDRATSLATLYLALTAGLIAFAFQINVYKTDHEYLYIYKPLLFFYLREKWDNIQAVIIEKDLTSHSSSGDTRSFSILTHQKKLTKYKYQLPPKTHKMFVKYLEDKVQDVRLRTKSDLNLEQQQQQRRQQHY